MAPHKHKDLIIAWANGAEIQMYSTLYVGWVDCPNPVWADCYEYRIKPRIIKYRNFLWRAGPGTPARMTVVEFDDNIREYRTAWRGFVRWVGDWQETEVP